MKKITVWNKETEQLYKLACNYASYSLSTAYNKPSEKKVMLMSAAEDEFIESSSSEYLWSGERCINICKATSRTLTVSFQTPGGIRIMSTDGTNALIPWDIIIIDDMVQINEREMEEAEKEFLESEPEQLTESVDSFQNDNFTAEVNTTTNNFTATDDLKIILAKFNYLVNENFSFARIEHSYYAINQSLTRVITIDNKYADFDISPNHVCFIAYKCSPTDRYLFESIVYNDSCYGSNSYYTKEGGEH